MVKYLITSLKQKSCSEPGTLHSAYKMHPYFPPKFGGMCPIVQKIWCFHMWLSGLLVWASSHKPKGRRLDSQSGHVPGFWPGPHLGIFERQSIDVSLLHILVSLLLFLPPPFSKNKQIKSLKIKK